MPGIREWLNSHGLSEYADRLPKIGSIFPSCQILRTKILRSLAYYWGIAGEFCVDHRARREAASSRYVRVASA